MVEYRLPKPNASFINSRGEPTTEWYNWLRKLEELFLGSDSGLQAQISEIAMILGSPDGTVANIPPFSPGLPLTTMISGQGSVVTLGTLADGSVIVTLANDNNTPGNDQYYGTNEAGQKGFWSLPEGSSMLPIVTGEIMSGQPVFVIGPNGSLIFGPVYDG